MARAHSPVAILSWTCAALLVLGYACFAWRMTVNPAFTFDELWFQALAAEGGFDTLFAVENRLGYGAAYWIVFKAAIGLSPLPALLTMRMLSFVALLAIPLSLVVIAAKQRQPIAALGAVLLWVALPMAWWDGKQAGPDVFSYAAACLGFALVATKAHWRRQGLAVVLGGVLLGFGIGLKLTAVVGLAAAAVVLGFRQAGQSIRFAAGSALGFLIANPFFALLPQAFFKNLEDAKREDPADFWTHLQHIFFADRYEWDGVYAGGFTHFGYSLLAFGLLVALVFWAARRRELGIALLAAFLVSTLLLLSNQRFLGWYWFPFLALTPFFVAMLEFNGAQRLLLGLLLVLQIFGSADTIATAYRNRMEHIRILAAEAEMNRCLEAQAGPLQDYKAIIAMLDPGFKLRAGRATGSFDGYRALRDRAKIGELQAKGEPFLLLVSARLAARNGVNLDAYRDLKDAKIGTCDAVNYLAIRPAAVK